MGEKLFTCSISITGLCWQVLGTQAPPPLPILHPVCRMLLALLSHPDSCPSPQGWHGVPAQGPGFRPHWLCHHWKYHQLGPALTTVPSQALGSRTPPAQPPRAAKGGFHPKALPFVPKAPGLMLSNAPALCRAAHWPGRCPLVYQGLTGEAVPAAFYHSSLHLPSQSKQAPSGPATLRAGCAKPCGNE